MSIFFGKNTGCIIFSEHRRIYFGYAYKNSLDERFLRELSVPDRIGKNQKSSFRIFIKNLTDFAS